MSNIKIRTTHGAVSPLIRSRPERNRALEAFVTSDDGFSAYVHAGVLDVIKQQAELAGRNEAIGLLAGRICQDPRSGPYTLVMAAAEAREGEFQSSPTFVRLLPVGLARLRGRLTDAHPDREIVGWYHTHPNFPPEFSVVDTEQQATWSDPNHIGIVYSGINHSEPFGVYRGPQAILLRRMHNERIYDEVEAKTKFESNFLPPSPMQPSRNLTPRSEPQVRIPGNHKSDESAPHDIRRHKLKWLVFTALAFVFVGQAAGLLWIHRRVSVAEKRLHELSGRKAKEQFGEKEAAQTQSNSALTQTATPSGSDSISVESAVQDGPDLPTRAKPSTPTTKIRQQSQTKKPSVSPSNKPGKDRDRQSRSENRAVRAKTQRAGGKSVETLSSPKVVAPAPGPQPTPRQ